VILADTSVWIDHLRSGDPKLTALLETGAILGHPFVTGEIALGSLRHPARVIADLRRLPQATTASPDEILDVIRRRSLQARGIGYVDAHLIAAVLLTPHTLLWTKDRHLNQAAADLSLLYLP